MKFAKLFETDNNSQVLVTLNYNEEDDKYEMTIRSDFEGGTPTMTLTFDDEEKANKGLEKYNQENAESFREKMREYFD